MVFKKDDKKPINSGRKKGTPNKVTADIRERLKKEDIVSCLLEIAHTTNKEEIKFYVYKELMKYCYPQLKSVDLNTTNDNGFNIFINHEPVEVQKD